jgi:nitroreductase/NAD-dependent dihydropyrimidine dehydrogenase PreA subunit
MEFLQINTDLCLQDGHCAEECPARIITMNGGSKYPEAIEGAEENCIKCGHCVAICPNGAISVKDIRQEDCTPIKKDFEISANQVGQLIKSRRSIRSYKSKKVDKAILESLIEIARYAPTGSNGQQVEWLAINSPEKVNQCASATIDFLKNAEKTGHPIKDRFNLASIISRWESGHDVILRNAPALIVVHAPRKNGSAMIDCTIALSYLDLAASAFGLGGCWAGYFMVASSQSPEIAKSLNLPEGNIPMGALMIGYPKFKYHRIPPRNVAKVIWKV